MVMAMSSLISFSVTMIKLLLMLLKLNLVLLLPLMLALKTILLLSITDLMMIHLERLDIM